MDGKEGWNWRIKWEMGGKKGKREEIWRERDKIEDHPRGSMET